MVFEFLELFFRHIAAERSQNTFFSSNCHLVAGNEKFLSFFNFLWIFEKWTKYHHLVRGNTKKYKNKTKFFQNSQPKWDTIFHFLENRFWRNETKSATGCKFDVKTILIQNAHIHADTLYFLIHYFERSCCLPVDMSILH